MMIVIDVEFILDWRGLQLPAPGAGKRKGEAPMAALRLAGLPDHNTTAKDPERAGRSARSSDRC